ncbi:MAG: choice-of-anchor R domain-containing protein [Candidatus Paceibacterota bacterium]
MKKNCKTIKRNGGAAMLISVVFFLFISLAIIAGLVSPTVREFRNALDLTKSRQSFFLSESGVEDAYFRLKKAKTIGSSVSLTLNNNTATTIITDSGFNQKTVSSLGDVNSRQRKNELVLNTGTGVSFSYGVQVGTGGITIGQNAVVNGSVYSNGDITGPGSITGTALAANSAALTADQANGSGAPTYDVTFGNANGTQDFAQSFSVSTNGVINQVKLYIRRVSTPGNLTVRIVSNSGSSPGTTTLASGLLDSSLVSVNYPAGDWVNVPISPNAELTAGTTYWIVIDGGTNSNKYYQIGANSNSYASGIGKIGAFSGTWNNTTPTGLDGFFQLYLGGLTGTISNVSVGAGVKGNTYAHTVKNSNIVGTNYCQVGSGNNKACNTSLPDPTQVAMPISDQNILDWKAEAEAGGVYSGNYVVDSTSVSFGPKKITGNLTMGNSGRLTLTGNLWVEGNMVIDNHAHINLSSSYGTSEGVIIVDGTVNIGNGSDFSGSGSEGSYLMVLSTSTSTDAIKLSNNGGAVILYAANGTVHLENNAAAKALNGKYIVLDNNVDVIYDSGLVNSNFVNGPSGGWGITSWKEVE